MPAVDRLSGQLSGGMRRKLGFCLAMWTAPTCWCSTSRAPASTRSAAWTWAAGVSGRRRGSAVVMSTTYLDEAERAPHCWSWTAAGMLVAGSPARSLLRPAASPTRGAPPRCGRMGVAAGSGLPRAVAPDGPAPRRRRR